MKNALKLIIEAVKIAISKISWNDLNDKPFYEEVDKNIIVPELTLENFEVLEDPIYVVVNQFTMTPIVGDTYTVNWDGNSYDVVAKDLDGLVYIGNENYIDATSGGDIPFAIIFGGVDIFVAVDSTEASYTEEIHTISIFTTQTNIKKIDEKYLPEIGVKSWDDLEDRPFGTEISKINLIEEQTITLDGSGSGNCISIDGYYEYTAVGTPYEIEFDGEIYTGTMYEDGDVSIRTDFTTSSGINVYMYDCSGIYSSSTLAGEHTIKLSVIGEKVNQIDDIYIPDTIARTQDLETKMDKNNPSGTGSLSIGRQPNTLTGLYSQAIGNGVMATSKSQHAIGEFNDVTNDKYVQEVENKKSVEIPSTRTIYISDNYTFDANTGVYALVEPCSGLASNYRTLISQNGLTGKPVYIMGSTTTSSRMYSSPGSVTVAVGSLYLYTVDMYTSLYAPGARGKYAHVVGNGISDTARSNAHTLDWDGNAWYQGTIKLGGTSYNDASEVALKSDVPIKLSELTNDSGFITKNVTDLVNYYKKTEVYSKNEIDAKKYLTEHQDLSAYAKTSQIPTKVSQLTNDSKFLTAIPNEYVTESELEGKGYLTQHQDLSSYAKKSTTLAGYGITDAATKTELTKLDNEKIGHTELTNEVASALQTAKDSGTFDGQDGDDGVSCTHSWNGTTLTITSASGSSSANLKGDKGDKGDKGVSGVYVGSGSMPSGYNIQIDPEGDADYGDLVTREEFDRLEETIVDSLNCVTPQMYGAKADGVTDDTEAIAQAIADMNDGDELYFPSGVYRVSNINLKSNMSVRGDGWESVIKLLDATTDYNGHNNCINMVGVENIIIRDIKLDGNRATQQSTASSQDQRLNGLHIRNASDITVKNVWMYNNGYHGCIMTYTANVTFSHCKATDNGFRPIHGHTKIYNCRLSNCLCENNGLGLTGGSGFENDSIFFFGVKNLVINDNIVKSNRRGCITIEAEIHDTDVILSGNITISGNVCECYEDLEYVKTADSNTGVAKFSSQGIVVIGGDNVLENISVVGNTIKNAHEGINLYSITDEIHSINTVISGNVIIDCSYGVKAVNVSDVLIANNQFRNLTKQLMYAQNISDCHIHGNNVNALGISENYICTIHDSNRCDISDNNIIGDSEKAIYVNASSNNVVVKNNTIFGFEDDTSIVNTNGHTLNNLCISLDDSSGELIEKVCVDPYSNTGFVRPTLVNPNTTSTNWYYTTPVAITGKDTMYELNCYLNVPIEYSDPSQYDESSGNYTGIVFLSGEELTKAVGIVTMFNGIGIVKYSDNYIEGASKNVYGVNVSITVEEVMRKYPTATHVMMQVASAYKEPDALSSVMSSVSDGHAYVYRKQ